MKLPLWFRHPFLRPVRIILGCFIVLCGFLGFLPILGFWMIPVGLTILAIDIPAAARLNDWLRHRATRVLVRLRGFWRKHGYGGRNGRGR